MNDKMQQNIENKIKESVEEILRVAKESLDNNHFIYRSEALAVSLPENMSSVLKSFIGDRILTIAHPILEEMFDNPVYFDLGMYEIEIPIESNKKTRK